MPPGNDWPEAPLQIESKWCIHKPHISGSLAKLPNIAGIIPNIAGITPARTILEVKRGAQTMEIATRHGPTVTGLNNVL